MFPSCMFPPAMFPGDMFPGAGYVFLTPMNLDAYAAVLTG